MMQNPFYAMQIIRLVHIYKVRFWWRSVLVLWFQSGFYHRDGLCIIAWCTGDVYKRRSLSWAADCHYSGRHYRHCHIAVHAYQVGRRYGRLFSLIDGKFISPQIMGKSLHTHPITIIFVLLTAGSLFGVPGVILGIPGYALLKVVVTHLFKLFKMRYNKHEADELYHYEKDE